MPPRKKQSKPDATKKPPPSAAYYESKNKKGNRAGGTSSDESDNGEEDPETDYENEVNRKKASVGDKKGKKRAANGDESEEEDASGSDVEGGEGANGKGKKGKQNGVPLSNDERTKLVKSLSRHVYFLELNRKPFKKEDWSKTALGKSKARHYPELIKLAQEQLRSVFGFEMVAMRGKIGSTTSSKALILRSTLPTPLLSVLPSLSFPFLAHPSSASNLKNQHALQAEVSKAASEDSGGVRDWSKEGLGGYALLGLVLGLILVSGRAVSDEQLTTYLRRFHLSPSAPLPSSLSPTHSATATRIVPYTLNSYLLLLVKQGYLERHKTAVVHPGMGATQSAATQAKEGRASAADKNAGAAGGAVNEAGEQGIEWRWGSRSEIEFTEKGIASFMCELWSSKGDVDGDDDDGRSGGEEEDEEEEEEEEDNGSQTAASKGRRTNGASSAAGRSNANSSAARQSAAAMQSADGGQKSQAKIMIEIARAANSAGVTATGVVPPPGGSGGNKDGPENGGELGGKMKAL